MGPAVPAHAARLAPGRPSRGGPRPAWLWPQRPAQEGEGAQRGLACASAARAGAGAGPAERQHQLAQHLHMPGRELVLALDLRSVVLVGHDDGARLGLAVAQAEPARFCGAWLMNAWPAGPAPDACVQWFAQAARKPSWPVGRAMHEAGEEAGAQPQAWNLPFSHPGHRAALQAWPGVQAEMPALPMELLVQWSQQQRLWVQDRKSVV